MKCFFLLALLAAAASSDFTPYKGVSIQPVTIPSALSIKPTVTCSSLGGPYCTPVNGRLLPPHLSAPMKEPVLPSLSSHSADKLNPEAIRAYLGAVLGSWVTDGATHKVETVSMLDADGEEAEYTVITLQMGGSRDDPERDTDLPVSVEDADNEDGSLGEEGSGGVLLEQVLKLLKAAAQDKIAEDDSRGGKAARAVEKTGFDRAAQSIKDDQTRGGKAVRAVEKTGFDRAGPSDSAHDRGAGASAAAGTRLQGRAPAGTSRSPSGNSAAARDSRTQAPPMPTSRVSTGTPPTQASAPSHRGQIKKKHPRPT
jgi:hypothetical protein